MRRRYTELVWGDISGRRPPRLGRIGRALGFLPRLSFLTPEEEAEEQVLSDEDFVGFEVVDPTDCHVGGPPTATEQKPRSPGDQHAAVDDSAAHSWLEGLPDQDRERFAAQMARLGGHQSLPLSPGVTDFFAGGVVISDDEEEEEAQQQQQKGVVERGMHDGASTASTSGGSIADPDTLNVLDWGEVEQGDVVQQQQEEQEEEQRSSEGDQGSLAAALSGAGGDGGAGDASSDVETLDLDAFIQGLSDSLGVQLSVSGEGTDGSSSSSGVLGGIMADGGMEIEIDSTGGMSASSSSGGVGGGGGGGGAGGSGDKPDLSHFNCQMVMGPKGSDWVFMIHIDDGSGGGKGGRHGRGDGGASLGRPGDRLHLQRCLQGACVALCCVVLFRGWPLFWRSAL